MKSAQDAPVNPEPVPDLLDRAARCRSKRAAVSLLVEGGWPRDRAAEAVAIMWGAQGDCIGSGSPPIPSGLSLEQLGRIELRPIHGGPSGLEPDVEWFDSVTGEKLSGIDDEAESES